MVKKKSVATKKESKTCPKGTDTRSRVNKIKAAHREEMLKRLKGVEYINQLEQSAIDLDTIIKEIAKASKIKQRLTDREKIVILNKQIDLLDMRLRIIKEKINLNFRRLKFVLPELKSIELTDPDGNNPFADFVNSLKMSLQDND